jgi:hypothetical protein
MPVQSLDEIRRVYADWEANYKPANIPSSDFNVKLVVDYIQSYFGGITSVSNLCAAVVALDGQLEKIKGPTPEEQMRAYEAKETKRRLQEAADNAKPRQWGKADEANKRATLKAKAFEDATAMINTLIKNFSVNGRPGETDYAATEAAQEAFREIRVEAVMPNGAREYRPDFTLSIIQRIYHQIEGKNAAEQIRKLWPKEVEKVNEQAAAVVADRRRSQDPYRF